MIHCIVFRGADTYQAWSRLYRFASRPFTMLLLLSVWLLMILSLGVRPSVTQASGAGSGSGNDSCSGNLGCGTATCTPVEYSGIAECKDTLLETQSCLPNVRTNKLFVSSEVDQERNNMILGPGLADFSSSTIIATPECAQAVLSLICFFHYGLCNNSTGVPYLPSSNQCIAVRDVMCPSEWSIVDSSLPGVLPVCEELPHPSIECLVLTACNAEVTDTTFGSYTWPDTAVGSISEILCELGSVSGSGDTAAFAIRRCLEGGQWEDPDFSQCADTFDTIEDINITSANYEDVMLTLSDGVETAADDLEGQNVENILTVGNILVETAALLDDNERIVVEVDTVNETVEILDNLQEWNATVVALASANIVESIENIVSSYAVQENFTELVVEGDNLAFVVERVELQTLMESGRGFSLAVDVNGTLDANTGGGADNFTELASDEVASAFLPPSLFTVIENRSETGVFFSLYQTAVLFPLGEEAQVVSPGGATMMVGSPIIAATIAGQEEGLGGFPDPVSILIRLRTAQNITTVTCVSYDFDAAGGRGNWSSEGCETKVIDDGDSALDDEDIVNCSCNHLTNFAVLMDICSRTGGCEISSEAQLALDIISIIGVVLSLFGTIGTIITLLAFKKLRQRDPTKFHVQLCIALFCMLLVFLIGIDRNEVSEGCVIVSVLIHYFTLVAVMWMGAEAVLMYQKLVTVFVQITVRYMFVLSLVCWLVPIVPAVIPAALDWHDVVTFTDSGDIDFCFIGNTAVFFAAFLAPILAVILFNFVIFFIVAFVLIRHTMNNNSRRVKGEVIDIKTAIHLIVSVMGVMFLFGLTWVFGALTIAESEVSLTFQILFAIFNSLQGFFIFLFFCVLNKNAREAWKSLLTCGYHTLHTFHSKYINVHKNRSTTPSSKISLGLVSIAYQGPRSGQCGWPDSPTLP